MAKKEKKNTSYYECKRCDINSMTHRMCPCPRGGCEAVRLGHVETTTKLVLDKDNIKSAK